MNEVLSIKGLSKSFGAQQVIDHLDISVPEGTVFGFIGQNGSGKTTTMKMVLGLLVRIMERSPSVVKPFDTARRKPIVRLDICPMYRNFTII